MVAVVRRLRPRVVLAHLTGQTMPKKFLAQESPSRWDWRTLGKVTPVKNQGACGACYAFAALGDMESKLLIDGAGVHDFSENNAKECNWWELADTGLGGVQLRRRRGNVQGLLKHFLNKT